MSLDAASACGRALPHLTEGAALIGFALSTEEADAFVRYCRLLSEVGRHTNLTAVRDAAGIMRTLFLDSLSLVPALPDWALRGTTSVVDIGSGAGFPAMPLKILFPQWEVTLVESVGKKARFLDTLATELRLTRVSVVNARAEELAREPGRREGADLATARAVASLASLVELCAPLVRSEGLLVFPKSGDIESELRDSEVAASRLGCLPPTLTRVPRELGLGESRLIVTYRRQGHVPHGYPRRTGLAQSRPLGH